jgi:hypothetical protein
LPSSLGEEDVHTLNWRKTWEKIDNLEAENRRLQALLDPHRHCDEAIAAFKR